MTATQTWLSSHKGNETEGNADLVLTFMSSGDANTFAKDNRCTVTHKTTGEGWAKVPDSLGGGWIKFPARKAYVVDREGRKILLQVHEVDGVSPYLQMGKKGW